MVVDKLEVAAKGLFGFALDRTFRAGRGVRFEDVSLQEGVAGE